MNEQIHGDPRHCPWSTGKGGFAGKYALSARCSITLESIVILSINSPAEISATSFIRAPNSLRQTCKNSLLQQRIEPREILRGGAKDA